MTKRTLKQLFKLVNEHNDIVDSLGQEDLEKNELLIYIDDERTYKGTNFNKFSKLINEEYVKGFLKELENVLFVGKNHSIFVFGETKHTVSVYVI